jgi:hypothetical protein
MKKTQSDRIISKLNHDGFVTRNEALQNFISRLGAIICDLTKEGWDFKGEFIKTKNGTDYKYTVITSPFKSVKYTTEDGRTIIKFEKR